MSEPGASKLILIIDDSPTEVHVMSTALRKHGFLIFMDVVMPGVNGFQATRTLASDPGTSGIPVVMVTSKNQPSDRIWGLRQGAVDYLVKPVSGPQLVAKAQAALAA
jgi:twitching motility two-component system response regulator PilH